VKDYMELTQRGRIRRLRSVAESALEVFDIHSADTVFRLNHATAHVSFRVQAPGTTPKRLRHSGQFVPDRYFLRLGQPGYQTTDVVESESLWLHALRADTGLPVPEPIRSDTGRFTVEVEAADVPGPRQCSLFRWVAGRHIREGRETVSHLRAAGKVMAQLHEHASSWTPPKGFTRWRYDWNGLYGDPSSTGVASDAVRGEVIASVRPVYDRVTSMLRGVMQDLGVGSNAFGLIHADFGLDANILFWHGEARPIDFNDSALGYWMFDLGVAVSGVRGRDDWPTLRDAFLAGYQDVRSIPEKQIRHLDLFIAAWHAFEIHWAAAEICTHPEWTKGAQAWQNEAGNALRRLL